MIGFGGDGEVFSMNLTKALLTVVLFILGTFFLGKGLILGIKGVQGNLKQSILYLGFSLAILFLSGITYEVFSFIDAILGIAILWCAGVVFILANRFFIWLFYERSKK
jgi:hypothetical protein